jgi:hypothetical protein
VLSVVHNGDRSGEGHTQNDVVNVGGLGNVVDNVLQVGNQTVRQRALEMALFDQGYHDPCTTFVAAFCLQPVTDQLQSSHEGEKILSNP